MDDIILASSSPRRKEMLEKYNINFKVVGSELIEKIIYSEKPEQIVMSLAFQKAYEISKNNPDKIIIGADTIVVYEDLILGKPKDSEDALKMLKLLNGKSHYVISGISIIQLNKNLKIVDYEITQVKFRKLEINKLESYVNTGEPLGKAGAYAIQDFGALLVEKIDGCYLNVIGLPLVKLDFLLNKFFKISLL